ncbi:MAG: hypothetical protein AB1Z19_07920, partial [Eubacteriales bacterium]
QALVILQGARRIGNVNARDINLMDFEKNDMVFERNLTDDIIITTPNIVSRANYTHALELHRKSGADITLIATKNAPDDQDHSCLFMDINEDHDVIDLTEGNPRHYEHQYAGTLIVSRETLLQLLLLAPEIGIYEMLDLVMANFEDFRIKCYHYGGYLRRISTIRDYFDSSMELLDPETSTQMFTGSDIVYTKIKDNHPTLYKSTSDVKDSCIASGSTIEGTVRNTVLFRQVHQMTGSKISNSILMEGCRIGKNTVLDYVIADRNVIIGDNVVLKGTKTSPVVLKKEMVI